MTTPGKNWPGERGFPTPNEIPEEEGYLIFRFPDNNDWAGLLLGAAGALAEHWNYFQWGAMTPNEAAEAWREIVNQAPYNLLESTVDTPYWDDETDVDDELSNEDQPWYGEVLDPALPPNELTFIENAAVLTMTGLLAIATAEVGFAPAIAFHTIAPKMILAVRNGDLGRIIRIFVDGDKIYEGTDAGDGSITNVPVVADPALDGHQIYITSGAA